MIKTNQSYTLVPFITALAVLLLTLSAPSFAQTVTPLSCSVGSSSVTTNQAATLTASGGTGVYTWSGTNLNVTNANGSQFAVSYPTAGTYTVIVTSGLQTATCNVVVVPATTGTLICSPAVQNVTLGQTASVSASGGTTGVYTWSSPDLTITNPNGTGFSANYASTGLKTLTVVSGGVAASCAVNVLASSGTPTPVPPGLPNTGGGYGK